MRRTLACLLLSLPLLASAQIYKYTDAQGNTVFTNQPPDGSAAQSVELPPTNTVQMQAPSVAPAQDSQTEAQRPYRTLQLTDLPDDAALRANNGTFSVGVVLEPTLASSHRLRLLLDGQPYGQPSSGTQLQLTNVARGEHSLAVEVLSGSQRIQQSDSVSFTVQRISVNSPARSAAPAPTPTPPPTPAPAP